MAESRQADTDELVGRLRDGYQLLQSLPDYSEADTRQHLIDPLIESLYDSAHVRREETDAGNCPDYVLYVDPVTQGGPAHAIVEAKPLGADFDAVTAGDRARTPHRQAERYLRDHAAGTRSTIGALTDGLRWRLYRKDRDDEVKIDGDEIDLEPLVCGASDSQEPLDTLFLAPEPFTPMLTALGARAAAEASIDKDSLQGVQRDQVIRDWKAHSHADGPAVPASEGEQVSLPGVSPPRANAVRLAAVQFGHSEYGIGRSDAARCARIFAKQTPARCAVAFVWQVHPGDGLVTARIVAALEGRVTMTQPFDPTLPPPAARAAATRVLELLHEEEVRPRDIADALDVLPLQSRFYEEIRAWVRRVRRDDGAFRGVEGEEERHDILLRHLIRTLFVWILKEECAIPPDLFDRDFVRERQIGHYHRDLLRPLFHERLNVEEQARATHPLEELADVPFLNGSLFEPRPGDERIELTDTYYWSAADQAAGLFDILGRYYWTADEQRSGEREQTLDPELLSNLFEQLVADPMLAEQEAQASAETLKAPDGAYYTPMDVTAEMAADALAAAVRGDAPAAFREEHLLNLFRDPDFELPDLGSRARHRLLNRITELRIFDPAAGSGAFLLAALQALQNALHKLHLDDTDQTRSIITGQLMGQDINPMAAQIARLRLFIALHHAEREETEPAPLPNLEARIICADTLSTYPAEAYDPFAPAGAGALAGADSSSRKELEAALRHLAAVREQWPFDSSESGKEARRRADERARAEIHRLVSGMLLAPQAARGLDALAAYPLLELGHDEPAAIDPRLLFAQDAERWQGFDIVIGNPPYQSFGKSGIGKAEVEALKARGYRTTNARDLYTLFCEAALALARQDKGVVTFVVPLSLAFGRRQRSLRAVFEERCRSVITRHHDTIPDTIFNQHPLFKGWKNRQRATIVTGVRGEGAPDVTTGALLRWGVADRGDVLPRRDGVRLSIETTNGWPRIPTEQVQEMIQKVAEQSVTVDRLRHAPWGSAPTWLSLPKTAGYFVSVLPEGVRACDGEWLMHMPDEETALLVMAALNGHIGYAWWRVFGDGFHVKLSDFAEFAIPDAWRTGEKREWAVYLGQELVGAIPTALKVKRNAGKEWPTADFFEFHPQLIDELDRFHLESLGLDANGLLLSQLRRLRSPDGWGFG